MDRKRKVLDFNFENCAIIPSRCSLDGLWAKGKFLVRKVISAETSRLLSQNEAKSQNKIHQQSKILYPASKRLRAIRKQAQLQNKNSKLGSLSLDLVRSTINYSMLRSNILQFCCFLQMKCNCGFQVLNFREKVSPKGEIVCSYLVHLSSLSLSCRICERITYSSRLKVAFSQVGCQMG